jgi:hypothetical protein
MSCYYGFTMESWRIWLELTVPCRNDCDDTKALVLLSNIHSYRFLGPLPGQYGLESFRQCLIDFDDRLQAVIQLARASVEGIVFGVRLGTRADGWT